MPGNGQPGCPSRLKREAALPPFGFWNILRDMGIEAQAPTCEELFVQVAKGLLVLLAGSGETPCSVREITLEIGAGDLEELLVVWLNELLYLIQTKGLWPQRLS